MILFKRNSANEKINERRLRLRGDNILFYSQNLVIDVDGRKVSQFACPNGNEKRNRFMQIHFAGKKLLHFHVIDGKMLFNEFGSNFSRNLHAREHFAST